MLMSCNSLTNFEYEEAFAKTRTAAIRKKDILTLDDLEKGQLIRFDDVTRTKLA